MYMIDEIISMLDCVSNDKKTQKQAIKIAKKMKHFEMFFQPNYPSGKRTWQNCAEIICSKSNEELEPFLNLMFDWIEDLNWPGALLILKRMTYMSGNTEYEKYKKDFFNKLRGKHNEYVIDYYEDYEKMKHKDTSEICNTSFFDNNKKIIVDIDKIYEMIDINNFSTIQKQGIELAKNIKCLDCFIISFRCKSMRNVQKNCAKIICNKSCKELEDCMMDLLYLIKDLTIPERDIICKKLREIKKNNSELFDDSKKIILSEAIETNDKSWINLIQNI